MAAVAAVAVASPARPALAAAARPAHGRHVRPPAATTPTPSTPTPASPARPALAAAARPAHRRHLRPLAATPTPTTTPTPDGAWAVLRAYTAADAAGKAPALVSSRAQRGALKAALLAAAGAPNPAAGWDGHTTTGTTTPRLLLAVLASSPPIAARALRDYCGALGVPYAPPAGGFPPDAARGVYLKWRPGGGGEGEEEGTVLPRVSASAYSGPDRGVLITFGSEQVGHLPLGLIDEDRTAPPPPLA
jgi:hypothetical protein